MQENEFEKRVQQQMEEFRLRPSDAVWEKVEEELRKKKKRRVVFFIFLLAGLSLLGYTGYFLVNQSKQNIADQTFTQQPNNDSAEKNNAVSSPATGSTTSNENGSIIQEPLTIKPNPTENAPAPEELKSNHTRVAKGETRVNDQPAADKTVRDAVIKKSNAVAEKTANQKNARDNKPTRSTRQPDEMVANNETTVIKGDVTVNDEKKKTEETAIAQTDPANNIPIIKDQLTTDSLRKDSALAKVDEKVTKQETATVKTKMSSKLRWGFDLAVGFSGMRDNAFLFSNGQKSMMDRVYNSPGNSSSGGFYTPPVSPSSTKAGPAFKLGIVAQKEITKRSSVSAGLQYAYLNTRMKIGSYWNTSVVVSNAVSQSLRLDAVYRAAPQKNYTNHYHFIQLPIQYHLQLNKGKKLPLLWNVGASLGYLVNTNALVYDTTAGGIYYRDKDIFNKWQENLNTGFSFLFGKSQKLQWSVGPEISLGMNKLVKDTYSQKQYLLYGGLSGRVIFPRKK